MGQRLVRRSDPHRGTGHVRMEIAIIEDVQDALRHVLHITTAIDESVHARLHVIGGSVAATPVRHDDRKAAVHRFGDGQ